MTTNIAAKKGHDSSWLMPGAAVICALGLYVGAYASLCKPAVPAVPFVTAYNLSDNTFALGGANTYAGTPLYLTATYRFGGKTSERIFAPLQELDQKLFPKRWIRTFP